MSHHQTPRFRNLSIVQHSYNDLQSRQGVSSFYFDEKDREKDRDPEKECFMCRQANVYLHPIGLQHEQRVTRRNPPPLSRAEIEELSRRTHLSKREARLLLLCFFPEIKNVKYFQLHRYHSCCYDPRHLSLCKNHISALQQQREKYPHPQHPHHHSESSHQLDESMQEGAENRVSFVRIKIEPHNGIPTRFLGPAVLPESLVTMLIKQVNRFEDKKKPVIFESAVEKPSKQFHTVRRIEPTYIDGNTSRVSEYLSTLPSTDDSDSDNSDNLMKSRNGNIRGFRGEVMNGSRFDYTNHERVKATERKTLSHRVHGDLVLEDLDDLKAYLADDKPEKKKRRKKKRRNFKTHQKPKLNHWELKALEQAQQESCGCRHHVRRMEADHIVYNWCRCKDHQHRDLHAKPEPEKKPKPIKVETKSIGLDAMPEQTTEIALAYNDDDLDYDIIQETLYYRTSSGRLVKPEITQGFPVDKLNTKKDRRGRSLALRRSGFGIETIPEDLESNGTTRYISQVNRSASSSVINGNSIRNGDGKLMLSSRNGDGEMQLYRISRTSGNLAVHGDSSKNKSDEDDDKSDEATDQDDDDDDGPVENFVQPKSPQEKPAEYASPIPLSMQKSSKPVFSNEHPTPNFERESSLLTHRRWFDQPLGDQNLREVHDGRYGLIAGTSTEQYKMNSTIPDNDYVDPYPHRTKNNCTIS